MIDDECFGQYDPDMADERGCKQCVLVSGGNLCIDMWEKSLEYQELDLMAQPKRPMKVDGAGLKNPVFRTS